MVEPRAAGRAGRGAGGLGDLFSVDADAHLRKLAACMFPTPAQLPVELVRAALARGASAVTITIGRRRIAIADDGAGIEAGLWQELENAFDPGLAAAARETAIAALQRAAATGIGLLAVFVPGSLSIRIESSSAAGNRAMEIVDGRARPRPPRSGSAGTRISITRHGTQTATETKLLGELCAGVAAAVTLNGRPLEKRPLLRRCLVRQRLASGSATKLEWIAIPIRGDACRIWLLDQQIPWQAYTSEAYKGLVFEVALEAATLPAAEDFRLLADAAHSLYHWLAERYPSFPAPWQERIEELIFKRAKASVDPRLLSSFSPFRLHRSRQRLNLDEVRRLAAKRPLYVLPPGGDKWHRFPRRLEALQLTTPQRDFLLNHLQLPLVETEAEMADQGPMSRLFMGLGRLASKLAAALPRLPLAISAAAELSEEERKLCRELEDHWRKRPQASAAALLAVRMAAGRGWAPAVLQPGLLGNVWVLRRRHPLVAEAVRRVHLDSANAELAFEALVPLPLLTPVRR